MCLNKESHLLHKGCLALYGLDSINGTDAGTDDDDDDEDDDNDGNEDEGWLLAAGHL